MKKLISVLLCTILISCTFTFKDADSEEFSKDFNKVFTNTKEVTLFCGKPDQVAYYLGYNFRLLPVSTGTTYDLFEEKFETVFFVASPDLKSLAILLMTSINEVCVSSISVDHKLYVDKNTSKQ